MKCTVFGDGRFSGSDRLVLDLTVWKKLPHWRNDWKVISWSMYLFIKHSKNDYLNLWIVGIGKSLIRDVTFLQRIPETQGLRYLTGSWLIFMVQGDAHFLCVVFKRTLCFPFPPFQLELSSCLSLVAVSPLPTQVVELHRMPQIQDVCACKDSSNLRQRTLQVTQQLRVSEDQVSG